MRAILAAVLILVLYLPGFASAQQTIPVEKCARECDPKTLNGPDYKTGNDTVTVFLFAHFQDILNMAPLNTQAPTGDEPDVNRGFLMPTIATNSGVCAGGGPICPDFHFRNNEFTLFSSPGLVIKDREGWITQQTPGLSYDIEIVGPELTFYWYMSAHTLPEGSPDTPVGVVPAVGIYTRMETGRFKYRGDVIAESNFSAEPTSGRSNLIVTPGEPAVYEFQVKMNVHRPVIPGHASANGFILAVQPYQVATAHEAGTQVMQPQWRVRTGPDFPPRLLLPTKRPLETFGTNVTMKGDDLLVQWDVRSALGSYDRREDLRRLEIVGAGPLPAGAAHDLTHPMSYWMQEFRPPNSTWLIDTRDIQLPDGSYQLRASIPNLQDTYLASQTFDFEIKRGQFVLPGMASFQGNATPFPTIGLLLAAVALSAFLRRP